MAGNGKKKKYEPPVVKEIGGIYEQARGVSSCAQGSLFSTDPCSAGVTPGGVGCSGGTIDQGCFTGATDAGGCSRGVTV
jgi:hypothetical protein